MTASTHPQTRDPAQERPGPGWMIYPEHAAAIEFGDGTSWLFDPWKLHCCSPDLDGKDRIGLGLYSKLSLAPRGVLDMEVDRDLDIDFEFIQEKLKNI